MKFATYFEKTQIPEWKKAYIDYVGLKRIIKALAAEKELNEDDESPYTSNIESNLMGDSQLSNSYLESDVQQRSSDLEAASRQALQSRDDMSNATALATEDQPMLARQSSAPKVQVKDSEPAPRPPINRSYTDHHPGLLQNFRRRTTLRVFKRTISHRSYSERRPVLPLSVVLPHFTPHKLRFYKKIDQEVTKVETFYRTKEKEYTERAEQLQLQFQELSMHHGRIQEARDEHKKWRTIFSENKDVSIFKNLTEFPKRRTRRRHQKLAERVASEFSENDVDSLGDQVVSANKKKRVSYDEYKVARKRLKTAVIEHYRGLELLNNYRILNLTGIRKALQKFEWVTEDRSLQGAFMEEKVEPCSFASGKTVEALLKKAEEYYTIRFARGDVKAAYHRLRVTRDKKTYYWSTVFSAACIAFAIPALIHGVYMSFQEELRSSIAWDTLLYVYATLFVPTIFLLLIGINLGIWADNRINYQFIFELDVRTQLDYREYFRLPSFLFLTLSYAFWFSFNQVGANNIAPTTWPLAWLVFAAVILVNPLPIFSRTARYWFIRKVGRLLTAGSLPVEFPDFWIGDQLCSQTFALSNLFFFGCAYSNDWHDVWGKCSTSTHWVAPFVLSVIPFVCRGMQSTRRYVDTGLQSHLINAGKYTVGVIYILFYNLWKGHDRAYDFTMICYVLFATAYSMYATYWDLTMDWTLFDSESRYQFLRKERVYAAGRGHFVYYLAMVLDLLMRFHWVMYLPVTNSSFNIYQRSFIGALIEIIRRWQWNFFRLENEHIGNTDQYRVTREVPLPYEVTNTNGDINYVESGEEDDDEDEDEENMTRRNPSISAVKEGFRRRSTRMVHFFNKERDTLEEV